VTKNQKGTQPIHRQKGIGEEGEQDRVKTFLPIVRGNGETSSPFHRATTKNLGEIASTGRGTVLKERTPGERWKSYPYSGKTKENFRGKSLEAGGLLPLSENFTSGGEGGGRNEKVN